MSEVYLSADLNDLLSIKEADQRVSYAHDHQELVIIISIDGNDWRTWAHLNISGVNSHQDVSSMLGRTKP